MSGRPLIGLALLAVVVAPAPSQVLTFTHTLTTASVSGCCSIFGPGWGPWSTSASLPPGPVNLPISLVTSGSFNGGGSLVVRSTPLTSLQQLQITVSAWSGDPYSSGSAQGHLTSTVAVPRPARLQLDVGFSSAGWSSSFASVDIGADGSREFVAGFGSQMRMFFLADARGTPVEWLAATSVQGSGNTNATLTMDITQPVQEQSYGAPCGGELGSQIVTGVAFRRIMVASLPGGVVSAWLVAGVQTLQLQLPGIACPLLCTPDFFMPLPLQAGYRGRTMVDLDVLLPPLPGQTWYAQVVGLDGVSVVGTNGVVVRT